MLAPRSWGDGQAPPLPPLRGAWPTTPRITAYRLVQFVRVAPLLSSGLNVQELAKDRLNSDYARRPKFSYLAYRHHRGCRRVFLAARSLQR